jgi:hypothetical protein
MPKRKVARFRVRKGVGAAVVLVASCALGGAAWAATNAVSSHGSNQSAATTTSTPTTYVSGLGTIPPWKRDSIQSAAPNRNKVTTGPPSTNIAAPCSRPVCAPTGEQDGIATGTGGSAPTWPSSAFRVTNSYAGTYGAGRIVIFAGGIPGTAGTTTGTGPVARGAIRVRLGGNANVTVSGAKQTGATWVFVAPVNQALEITAIKTSVVELATATGKTLTFNLSSGRYT